MVALVDYDKAAALIVTDVQNDFADPKGALFVSGGDQILEVVNDEIHRAEGSGALVVYTQDWHPPRTPHFAVDGGIWPVHCVQRTWGAEFVAGLEVVGPVIHKGTGGEDGYSGFTVRDPQTGDESPTELARLLADRGIERVVIVGLATDYCVRDTALDALREGLDTAVLPSGVRAVDRHPGDGVRALEELARAGVDVVPPYQGHSLGGHAQAGSGSP